MTVDIAAGMLAGGPRDGLNLHAAIRAANPAHGIGKKDGNIPERDEFEEPGSAGGVISGPDLAAARAARFAIGPGLKLGDDATCATLSGEGDTVINEALETVNFVE
jgi:hypothetical protein